MNRNWLGVGSLFATAVLLLNLASCAHNRHLVSIQVQPSAGGTFGGVDPSIFFNFKAFGTYIHPPQTVDITDQVNWQSDNPQVVQVSSTGVVSPNLNCGKADIFATFKDGNNEVISNSASVVVNGPANLGCTPAGPQPILTISFAGTGAGTVTGPGINCSSPSSCSNQFTVGTTIDLTASATGTSIFVKWSGCNSISGTAGEICSVFLQNNATVTATFN